MVDETKIKLIFDDWFAVLSELIERPKASRFEFLVEETSNACVGILTVHHDSASEDFVSTAHPDLDIYPSLAALQTALETTNRACAIAGIADNLHYAFKETVLLGDGKNITTEEFCILAEQLCVSVFKYKSIAMDRTACDKMIKKLQPALANRARQAAADWKACLG